MSITAVSNPKTNIQVIRAGEYEVFRDRRDVIFGFSEIERTYAEVTLTYSANIEAGTYDIQFFTGTGATAVVIDSITSGTVLAASSDADKRTALGILATAINANSTVATATVGSTGATMTLTSREAGRRGNELKYRARKTGTNPWPSTATLSGATDEPSTVLDNVVWRDVQQKTETEIKTALGHGSLTQRVLAWKKGARTASGGRNPALDVVCVRTGGAAERAGATVTFTGTASEARTLKFKIVRPDATADDFELPVASGATHEAVATAFGGKFSSVNDITATVSAGTVSLAIDEYGVYGNQFRVEVSNIVRGLTVTLADEGKFTGGVGHTDGDSTSTQYMGDALDAIGGIRYTGIAWPEGWGVAKLSQIMDERFNNPNMLLDGVAFQGSSDTYANNLTKAKSQDRKYLVLMGNTDAIGVSADLVASYFMGVRSKRLTPGAAIADLLVTTQGRADATGGPALASLPYFNTELTLLQNSLTFDGLYDVKQQDELEKYGFTVYGPSPGGNAMIMGPVVTTETRDAAGNFEDSFKYLNFVDTAMACKEVFFNTLRAKYSQSRLTAGALVPDRSMVNAQVIKAELLAIYRDLAEQALTQAGSDAEEYFAENTDVSVNLADRKVEVNGPLLIVTQLGVINYNMQITFNTAA